VTRTCGLIYGGDVKPININLMPSWKNFHSFLQFAAVQHDRG